MTSFCDASAQPSPVLRLAVANCTTMKVHEKPSRLKRRGERQCRISSTQYPANRQQHRSCVLSSCYTARANAAGTLTKTAKTATCSLLAGLGLLTRLKPSHVLLVDFRKSAMLDKNMPTRSHSSPPAPPALSGPPGPGTPPPPPRPLRDDEAPPEDPTPLLSM